MSRDCEGCRSRREFVHEMLGLTLAIPLLSWPRIRMNGQEVTYPVPPQDGASIDRDNQVILVRNLGKVYAFALSCPHQNTALRWSEPDHRFQCPKHHSKYQPDGSFISGRATRGMDRYEVRREGETLVVNLDRLFQEDQDHAGWLAAAVTL
jgi:nitrite reductase/ring-hydroxylating ferredoxin subunit